MPVAPARRDVSRFVVAPAMTWKPTVLLRVRRAWCGGGSATAVVAPVRLPVEMSVAGAWLAADLFIREVTAAKVGVTVTSRLIAAARARVSVIAFELHSTFRSPMTLEQIGRA